MKNQLLNLFFTIKLPSKNYFIKKSVPNDITPKN